MSINGTWDDSIDLVVVGSGGGSMCAALAAKQLGKRALIVEKQSLVGGSTGFSSLTSWLIPSWDIISGRFSPSA